MNLRVVGALVATTTLALPAAAPAATKTVRAGPFGAKATQFQDAFGDANAFLRRVVTVHKGDKVRWRMNGFHTVTFPPTGEPSPALIAPDPSTPIAGVNDAAGTPFWFNGLPALRPNLAAVAPQGGKRFDPSELMGSGLPPEDGPPPPYVLRFDRKGHLRLLLLGAPGDEGQGPRGGTQPQGPVGPRRPARGASPAAGDARARLAAHVRDRYGDLVKTIQASNDRRSGATIYRYFPAAPRFRVGDTVELRMPTSTPRRTRSRSGRPTARTSTTTSWSGASSARRSTRAAPIRASPRPRECRP